MFEIGERMSWIEDNASEINEAEGEFENLQRQVFILKAKLEEKDAEIERLKNTLPKFIKLDETTEAMMTANAALENMKMFQKDKMIFQQMNHELKNENFNLKSELEQVKHLANVWHAKLEKAEAALEMVKILAGKFVPSSIIIFEIDEALKEIRGRE